MASDSEKSSGDIPELLFSLASVDRLLLLEAVNQKKQRLTDLSKVAGSSAQECSRHLSRLFGSGFIRRDSESLYEITPLGKGVLSLLPGLRFLFSHREYFLTHDLSFLPRPFMSRIGELENCTYVEHFSNVLEKIKNTITGGQEFVWLLSDQPIVVGNTVGVSFGSSDLPVKFIFEPSVDRKILNSIIKVFPKSELAILEGTKIAMGINEKMGGVIFPDNDGKIDFGAGFYGEDPDFLGWCRDLFEYYWSRSKRIFQQ